MAWSADVFVCVFRRNWGEGGRLDLTELADVIVDNTQANIYFLSMFCNKYTRLELYSASDLVEESIADTDPYRWMSRCNFLWPLFTASHHFTHISLFQWKPSLPTNRSLASLHVSLSCNCRHFFSNKYLILLSSLFITTESLFSRILKTPPIWYIFW